MAKGNFYIQHDSAIGEPHGHDGLPPYRYHELEDMNAAFREAMAKEGRAPQEAQRLFTDSVPKRFAASTAVSFSSGMGFGRAAPKRLGHSI